MEPEIIHGEPATLLLEHSSGTVIVFIYYVNWDVFCNFSKNGRSNDTYMCCAKFVMNSSYIGMQLLTTL